MVSAQGGAGGPQGKTGPEYGSRCLQEPELAKHQVLCYILPKMPHHVATLPSLRSTDLK